MSNIRKELLDYLKTLDISVYETDKVFVVNAPTWKINPKTKLDDYLDDFVVDEHGALRDYAAIPTHSLQPFFKDPDILDRIALPILESPIDQNLIISQNFKPNLLFKYFFAGDLSVSGDNTGIAMCHYDTQRDKVVLDFTMAIIASRGSRVDYEAIRQLIYNLRDRGFNIKQVAFDQFQSNDCINILKQKNFNVCQVSYADSYVGNTTLHELIHTEKLEYGKFNTVFIGEGKELQIVNSKRIDHLKTDGFYNSKDTWDAAVNAVHCCLKDHYEHNDEEENLETMSSTLDKILDEDITGEDMSENWFL